MSPTIPRILLLLAALLPGACGREEEPPPASPAPSARSETNPLLRYVPAGTPYFVVTQERAPKAVALAHAARGPFDRAQLLSQLRGSAAADGDPQRFVERSIRVVELLPERFDEAGYASLGLRVDPHSALYGVGLLPVFRLELGDRATFLGFLERLFAALEFAPERARRGEREWFRVPLGPVLLHLTVGPDLMVTVAPADAAAEQLEILFGERLPERHLGDSGRLEELRRIHGFLGYQLGRIDTAAILAELERPTLAIGALSAAQSPLQAPECREEFAALARRYPGLDLGLRAFEEKRMDFSLVFRTTPELAQDLRRLAPALPEMPEAAPVVDVSLGLKIGELASLLGRWAAAIEQAPFRCEGLAPLNDLAAGFRAAAANPAVGMASMAGEGVLLRVDRIDLSNLQQPDFEATVVLAAPNPQGVVALLAGAMPEIANLGLVPGADPVAVPASALPTGIRSAFAALGERAAAVGFNHADGARVKRLVAAPTDARHRMFSIELTGVLVAELMALLRQNATSDPTMAANVAQLERVARDVERATIELRLGEQGVELLLSGRYR